MNSRRRFLQQTGILSAGLLSNSCNVFTGQKNVGIQLYTLRDEVFKDVKKVIGKIGEAGYKEVEMFGLGPDERFFGLTVKEFAQLLSQHNLTSPSGHYMPVNMLFENGNGDDVKKLCDAGNILGHKYIIIPYLEEIQRTSIDQYKKLAERMNKAGEICKQNNQQLAYHNHDFEFTAINGQRGYDVLLNDTDKDLLKFELDLYWVVRAGLDPVEIFKKQPGRFHLWHVKDMDKTDKAKNTEVGNGSIDFKRIMANAELSGVKHYLVEQENNYIPDYYTSVKNSCSYIKKELL